MLVSNSNEGPAYIGFLLGFLQQDDINVVMKPTKWLSLHFENELLMFQLIRVALFW